ncbi:PadR family transcriptional regulator [Paractinoplanes ferrugineus]|uniref:Transcriptional regulator n=1 Tax=Paractinoplanes ferrugineus TaxID=113564 RepID=A0A919IY94_9ACTN|nr:PadR family transcriptional regulator [Actinoplanes ferrugineus]GIE10379.1 transcriptional regulator [Actinoplanes ferrugineus]
MTNPVRVTAAVSKVLAVFLEDPEADRYGLDLMRASGHPSGTLYPILLRLQRAGWVDAIWEDVDPVAAGRPARRYYRLTPDGLVTARLEIAALRQQLDRASGADKAGVTEPRPA